MQEPAATASEPAPRTSSRHYPDPPENSVEIDSAYAEKMRTALADTDRLPMTHHKPQGPEPAEPMDWAEGTRDQSMTTARSKLMLERASSHTPTNPFHNSRPRLMDDLTTRQRQAAPPPPWIAPEEEQTTGLILLVDQLPGADPRQAPIVLPDDEVVFDFDEALEYLQVGDQTTLCHETWQRSSSPETIWDDDD